MVKVKICGLRTDKEIEAVNRVLPDYAGFVFASSKRMVTPNEAARLVERLHHMILPVGVFVNERVDIMVQTVKTCCLRVVQLHGDEGVDTIQELRAGLGMGVELWKAIRLDYVGTTGASRVQGTQFETQHPKPDVSPSKPGAQHLPFGKHYPHQAFLGLCDKLLYDGALPGSGRPLNLNLLPPSLENCILAGGLSPENIEEVLKKVRPYGVDVSSGVEGKDGLKDYQRMDRFVGMVRSMYR